MVKDSRVRSVLGIAGMVLVCMIVCGMANKPKIPNQYGIYTCRLDGSELKMIASDPTREINHARYSPDGQWITFTRYNNKGLKGVAEEMNGYFNTEAMLMRADGSNMQTIVPARPAWIAANCHWTPDGKSLIYISNNRLGNRGQISQINLETKQITRVPLPADLLPSDPHWLGDKIVFPVFNRGDFNGIWIANQDGSQARALTKPSFAPQFKKAKPKPGDCDPKLSPDLSKVAFMRLMENGSWHTVVVDVKTGIETDLTALYNPEVTDAVAEWSSDGKLLIFWHADTKKILNHGLYTMKPDGSDRTKIALPAGYLYTMPAFYPDDGSGPKARIIFSAKKMPALAPAKE